MTARAPENLPWDEPRLDRLKELWWNGRNASEIAQLIGRTTRNSVMGQVNRKALKRGPNAVMTGRQRASHRQTYPMAFTPKIKPQPKPKPTVAPTLSAVPFPKPRPAPSASRPTPFMLTTKLQCVWPIEPPHASAHAEMLCCGAASVEGRPYCEHHCRVGGAGYGYSKKIKPPFEANVVRVAV